METGSYQELQSKAKRSHFFAILITSVTIILCLLIGIGSWILIVGSKEPAIPVSQAGPNVIEEIVIVESVEPEQAAQVVQHPAEIDFTEGKANNVDKNILAEVQEAIKQEEEESFTTPRQPFTEGDNPFIKTLLDLSHHVANEMFTKFAESGRFAEIFGQEAVDEDSESGSHNRQRRSIPGTLANGALTYLNYLTFGKFMFNEVYSITEYAVEGRKMSGDADSFFLDNGFWPAPEKKKTSSKVQAAEKADSDASETTSVEAVQSVRPASAFDDGWTPMVNKVSLKFITDMLTTLLNLMREYLMRDNVMECLWFMFCKDMNHQAKYNDPMGYLARVNSVGLKVLTDKEGRQTDTVTGVWQALTQWAPLDCDIMFPKCDGSKALEIVNEVANASRK